MREQWRPNGILEAVIKIPNGSKELPSGTKINRLTIIKLHHIDKRWRRHYLCRCDCGNEKVIQGSLIISGNTKSCGCLLHEESPHKLPANGGVINHLILQYKRHAKDRGIHYNLSKEDFTATISEPCHYCGLPPSNNKVTKNCSGFLYSGIDRIDSAKGYEKGNIVPCCAICNRAKRDMPEEEFLRWIERAYKHSFENAMADQWGCTA